MLYLIKILILLSVFVFGGCFGGFSSSGDFKGGKVNDSTNMHKATMKPYTINGKTYYPTTVSVGDTATGIASWYGPKFHGKKTSNGEIFNMNAMTAAHKTLPMNTMVKVTNRQNGKTATVRINDRGPFVAGRIIDLSKAAANKINMLGAGTAPVKLEVVGFYGKINTKTTKSTTSQTASNTYSGGNFMVQIGSFKKQSGAQTYQKQYNKTDGYTAIVRTFVMDNEPIYRVFLSGFKSEAEARDYISGGKFEGAFIIRD